MSAAEIKELPLLEKFQILESIWLDLAERVEEMPLSASDKQLLDSRLARMESGEAQDHEWDEVKLSLGNK